MRDLRAMGETNVMRDRLRRPLRRDMLARAAAIYADRFGTPDGRVPATFEVIFLTGWAPGARAAAAAPPRLGARAPRRRPRRRRAERRRAGRRLSPAANPSRETA